MQRKKVAVIGIVLLLAVVGVVIGVIVSRQSSSSSASESAAADNSTASASGSVDSDTTASSSDDGNGKVTANNSSSSGSTSSITSDPTKATYSLAAFAIGDWGTTTYKSSCCERSSTYNDYDVIAEDVVASLMDTQAAAAEAVPKVIISHGDNFYWGGIYSDEGRDTRFTTTFEEKYTGSNIKTVPWVNVLGNHDYGGADFICSSGDKVAKCSSADDLIAALNNKFSWQSTYTSPNDNRWILEDHFYVHTITDEATGVSIDIFNVDTGDANTHGALETCCQCYGYSEGDNKACKNVVRGTDNCCGGDTDMFDACMNKFTEWSDDSRKQLAEKVASSTATWKVVNSHYSPYAHYAEAGMTEWFKLLQDSGIQIWLNGHTHGEKHDYSSKLKIHFVENGAGGGIQKESSSGVPPYAESYDIANNWVYGGQEYGFFSLTASEEWLKLQYHTTDSAWVFAEDISSATVGGVETKHCWYVPADGGPGQEC